jgi:hypothetical protein
LRAACDAGGFATGAAGGFDATGGDATGGATMACGCTIGGSGAELTQPAVSSTSSMAVRRIN